MCRPSYFPFKGLVLEKVSRETYCRLLPRPTMPLSQTMKPFEIERIEIDRSCLGLGPAVKRDPMRANEASAFGFATRLESFAAMEDSSTAKGARQEAF